MKGLIYLNENFRREMERTISEVADKYASKEKEIKENGRKIKAYFVYCSMGGIYFLDPEDFLSHVYSGTYNLHDKYMQITGDDELIVEACELCKGKEREITNKTKRTAPMRLRVRTDHGYCRTVDVNGWSNLVEEANRLLEEVFKHYMLEWEEVITYEYCGELYSEKGFDYLGGDANGCGWDIKMRVEDAFDDCNVILPENREPEYC